MAMGLRIVGTYLVYFFNYPVIWHDDASKVSRLSRKILLGPAYALHRKRRNNLSHRRSSGKIPDRTSNVFVWVEVIRPKHARRALSFHFYLVDFGHILNCYSSIFQS